MHLFTCLVCRVQIGFGHHSLSGLGLDRNMQLDLILIGSILQPSNNLVIVGSFFRNNGGIISR